VLAAQQIAVTDDAYLIQVIDLVKERCTLLNDFATQAGFFFMAPTQWDMEAVKPKWNEDKKAVFEALIEQYNSLPNWDVASIEQTFKDLATAKNIKPGELQLPMRVMLVGGKFGPAVFEIAAMIGKAGTIQRVQAFMAAL
jgi:glutamyl-tRNA synthetase